SWPCASVRHAARSDRRLQRRSRGCHLRLRNSQSWVTTMAPQLGDAFPGGASGLGTWECGLRKLACPNGWRTARSCRLQTPTLGDVEAATALGKAVAAVAAAERIV